MIHQLPFVCVFAVISTIYSELLVVRAASANQRRIEEIISNKIQWNQQHRSLQLFQTCTTYEYVAKIRDDLRMSYAVTSD